jgi:hypothetical protein
MSSPNIQGAWSKSKRQTSPQFSPSSSLSSSLHGSGIRQMHSRRGDTPIPIRALSFASDVVGGPNAASKRCGADPSIASSSAAFKKRRGGQVDIDDDSYASLLPQSKKRTARKKSATKRRCFSSIAQTSASQKRRSHSLSSINEDGEYLDSDDDRSGSLLLQSNRKKSARKHLGTDPSIASSSASKKKRRGGHVDSSDDTMPASLLPQARNNSHGGTSIACTSASKKKRGVDHSLLDKDEDDSDSGNEKDNKERDYVPVTNRAVNDLMEGKNVGDLAVIIASHKKAFMERVFPSGKEKNYLNSKSKSASIPSFQPKSKLDYIIYVFLNWQVGVQIRTMTPGYERDSLLYFHCQHKKGNKYTHQYHLEEVFPPGTLEPRTAVKRMVENEEGKMVVSRIVTCRENVFEAVDEWHQGNSHLGLERTWTYCKNTYWNVSQEHVGIYLKTCLTCMK